MDKIFKLKRLTTDESKDLVKQWEEMAISLASDEYYLTLDQTKKLISLIKDKIEIINSSLKETEYVTQEQMGMVNAMLARRHAYRAVLQLFNDKEEIESQKKTIERMVDEKLTKEEFIYPK